LLEELCDFQNGFAFKNSDYADKCDDTWEVFRMGNIARGGGFKEDSTPVFVQRNYPKKLDRYLLCEGDLTIAMTDMKNSMALLGHTARVPEDNRFALNQRVGLIRVRKTDILCPIYLYYFSNSPEYIAYLRSRANSGVQVNLSTAAIKESTIKVPSMDTQKAIGDLLKSLDDKIQLNHQINQTLEQMAQAIFKSWFVDFESVKAKTAALEAGGSKEDALLAAMQVIAGDKQECANAAKGSAPGAATGGKLARLQAEQPEQYAELRATAELFPSAMQESELGEIPEGWPPVQVEHFIGLSYGKALKKTVRVDGPYPVYGSGGITGSHNEPLVAGPGIIVGRKGTVGSIYWEPKDFFPIDTAYYVSPKNGGSLSFSYYLLQTLGLRDMNTDAAVPGLNRNNVYRLEIPSYPVPIIERFTQIADSISRKISASSAESDLLTEFRDTLLPKLFSGELTIPDAESQLAEIEEVTSV
jgi:type I restriction enzyme S subunit